MPTSAAAEPSPPRPSRLRRMLPWALLLLLLAVAQTLLLLLTVRYETSRAQDQADAAATEAVAQVRRELMRLTQALQTLTWIAPPETLGREAAAELLRMNPVLRRIGWREEADAVHLAIDSPFGGPAFGRFRHEEIAADTGLACTAARRAAAPTFSRSYFVPLPGGAGAELIDLCVPVLRDGRDAGFVVASIMLAPLLEAAQAGAEARRFELSFVEGDGARLARAGARRGTGVYVAERVLDLPGQSLRLRADSTAGRPSLIPNVATALVLGLSMALFALVLVLARDVRRRAVAEQALSAALGLRKAMEDSLSTGLRARDMSGAVTYVNPAFCTMVGYGAEELLAVRAPDPPPYWPPEHAQAYAERQRVRTAAGGGAAADAREGFESVFQRRNGERFPVMIFEAPLLDGEGRQTGWMGSVLDLTAQRRIEELSRQQQDRLQASARLATVGEMASLLSHELNQPLAAIASYASGSMNMLDAPDTETPALLRQALARIAEQAERAGRVIKSVHDFVRRREHLRETLPVDLLIEAVMPLVRLQARKSGARIELDLPPGPRLRVVCDRTMVEQVLLNLTRNAIQAMDGATPPAERVLTIRARALATPRVRIEVVDRGTGIAPAVAERLFTPFFTTRAEGMGLGLSLCRTVVEQHGGVLEFAPGPSGMGTAFGFTLPAARAADAAGAIEPAEGAGAAETAGTATTVAPAPAPGVDPGTKR